MFGEARSFPNSGQTKRINATKLRTLAPEHACFCFTYYAAADRYCYCYCYCYYYSCCCCCSYYYYYYYLDG